MGRTKNILFTVVALVVLFAGACYAQYGLDAYVKRVANLCMIYAIIGLSLQLINGFCGQFSLGQAGFMCIGAYVVGIFTVPVELRPSVFYAVPMNPLIADIHMPMWLALLVGGLLAAAVAFLVGLPVLRLHGDYLAIATLGFSEIIRIVITNAQSFTNGALGIKDIPPLNDVRYIFVVCALTYLFVTMLINSSYGRAFKAIREDEIAAEAMGIDLFKHKSMAFMLSAFFAGVGGGLYGALLGTVDPKNFLFTLTYNFVLIIVLGGMGSITGSMLGAILVTGGLEYLRVFDEPLEIFGTVIPLFRPGFRMVIFSVLLMICVLFWRKGIMGTEEFSWKKFISFVKNPIGYWKGAKQNG